MGVPTENTPVDDYTGFDNYGVGTIQFNSGSTTDVRSSSASDVAYYAAASGEGNVFINDTNEDFRISGIPVDGFSDLTLSFGLWKGSVAEDGSSLTVQVIIDSSTPVTVPVSLPTGPGTAVWHYQTPVLNLPAGSTLSLYFNGQSRRAFRVDDILIMGTANATPVVLKSFEAVRNARNVQLEWMTAQEKNSAYYEIQRSADGRSFVPVYRVSSQNDPMGSQYTFSDPAPDVARSYYRLQMVDLDGTSMYSPVRMVSPSPEQQGLRLVKNPVGAVLKIKIPDHFSYDRYRLYSLAGRQFTMPLRRESALLTADVSSLRPGVYLIRLEGQSGVHSLRFLKR